MGTNFKSFIITHTVTNAATRLFAVPLSVEFPVKKVILKNYAYQPTTARNSVCVVQSTQLVSPATGSNSLFQYLASVANTEVLDKVISEEKHINGTYSFQIVEFGTVADALGIISFCLEFHG